LSNRHNPTKCHRISVVNYTIIYSVTRHTQYNSNNNSNTIYNIIYTCSINRSYATYISYYLRFFFWTQRMILISLTQHRRVHCIGVIKPDGCRFTIYYTDKGRVCCDADGFQHANVPLYSRPRRACDARVWLIFVAVPSLTYCLPKCAGDERVHRNVRRNVLSCLFVRLLNRLSRLLFETPKQNMYIETNEQFNTYRAT